MKKQRGYFGIGICNGKFEENAGILCRSAQIFCASFIFSIGDRYKKVVTDTSKSFKSVPVYNYRDEKDFLMHTPYDVQLVAVEISDRSVSLSSFSHPERCIYLLGAEDSGIPKLILDNCQHIVQLPGDFSMNVSVAGSIVMYDRLVKADQKAYDSSIGL